jgi:hypothetical protein
MKLRTAILAALLLLCATPAFSQACSMCYSTAKATSKEGQRAISKGVVVLLLPPLGFMTLGVWAALRYGKKRDLEQARGTVLSLNSALIYSLAVNNEEASPSRPHALSMNLSDLPE